jgi:hypothetical protein
MKYRIMESIYYDGYGKEKDKHYYIQKRKSFLGMKYWSDIKHEIRDGVWIVEVNTQFKSYEDAYEFVKIVLCPQKKTNSWENKIVNEIEC